MRTPEAEVLRRSPKFRTWGRLRLDVEQSAILADERHYTPSELAKMWGVSVQTIREVFKNEDGVLKLGKDGTRFRRGYKTLRIPHSVVERVHTRLSAQC
jgi:hypothetical protein